MRWVDLRLIALVLVAFVLGGGGVGSAVQNLIVQLFALLILAIDADSVGRFMREGPAGLKALMILTLALPLFQLVPLPWAMWTHLPGRDVVSQAYGVIDATGYMAPISVAPARTLTAFLALLPPFSVIVLGWGSLREGRVNFLAVLLCLAVLGAALGAFQLASDNQQMMIQAEAKGSIDLSSTFANRNSAGLFFDMCLIALGCLAFGVPRSASGHVGVILGALALLACVVLTRSRSAMALSLLGLLTTVVGLVRARQWIGIPRAVQVGGGLVIVFATVSAFYLAGGTKLAAGVQRLDSIESVRPLIWQDTLHAIDRFGVVGAGMGTFDEVFQLDESIEYLDPMRAARAHNDWLEIVLEAGVAGAALVLAWVGWCVGAMIRGLRRSPSRDALAAALILGSVALQSVLDYPLRNEALLCIAALCLAVLATNGRGHDDEAEKDSSVRLGGADSGV